MITLPGLLYSKRFNLYVGAVFSLVWWMFSYAHLTRFQQTHDVALIVVVFSETLTAVLFFVRSSPKTISLAPGDWLIGVAGSYLPMLFRPAPWGVMPAASMLVLIGTALQIVGLLSLNRSFAIVAAKREIKTSGMYRLVRHPIYASYFLVFAGYVLQNTSPANALVYALLLLLLLTRIVREERHLALDPAYREYMLTVRYRLIPFVY
ncbi:methyltransferase family protein [Pseudogulbenkiania subflava]|uniref:Protein-S-isoprenylcysteine O-methyltransferase Ste14 n=1 Tax=Pseudogulbenkiania subflava DSM 22618 TaxID=1123014 RepID=A0A1Y6BGY8_9NEIS|nr:isoprenylcysteine carboxylmethyltransferase family protein [Pseudogulbenkiania subflava]SMF10945.1 Protein-S-isoprenylcysteine O-methyltransferase Ste14 [Pseudogulbenkiania subflava DSM 22618]